MADLGAWRGASMIECALCGAPGPRHYTLHIRRALWFSNEWRGDYRRLSVILAHVSAPAVRLGRALRVRLAARSYASEGGGPDEQS